MWKLNCGKIRMNTADVELLRKNTEWSKKERARNGWRKKKSFLDDLKTSKRWKKRGMKRIIKTELKHELKKAAEQM